MRTTTSALISLALIGIGPDTKATDIYKCSDADGGVVYTQMPCEDELPAESNKESDESDVESESAAPEITDLPPELVIEVTDNRTAEEIAACKKQYRDAIDEIDAELARDFDPEKADEYKQALLELTRQLRRC